MVPVNVSASANAWILRILGLATCLLLGVGAIVVYQNPIADAGNELASHAAEGWLLISLVNAFVVLPLFFLEAQSPRARRWFRAAAWSALVLVGVGGFVFMLYLAAADQLFLEYWFYFLPLTGVVWAGLALRHHAGAKARPAMRRILVGCGLLVAFLYLALTIPSIPNGELLDVSGPIAVALILLALGMGLGGGSLIVYRAAHPRWLEAAATIRSLGVASSLVTLLGLVVIGIAVGSSYDSVTAFAVPIYTLQVGIALCTLWLQTFPVTSPTARRIVNTILHGLALLSPIFLYIVLQGDPFQLWYPAMALGWLVAMRAQPMVSDEPLDGSVVVPTRTADASRSFAG